MSRYDAVTLDAYGTLVEVESPGERMRSAVLRRLGRRVSLERAAAAFRAEMAYYRVRCHDGRDGPSLAALRAACAAIVVRELGLTIEPERASELLLEAIRFRVFPDAPPALDALHAAGLPVAVVSNWDCSLEETLAVVGLRFDAVVDSAGAGTAKPDPAIFLQAARALGVAPARMLHVGDTIERDGAGARAAGMDVRILDRSGATPGALRTLGEVVPLVGGRVAAA